jgi:hypothetical protein
MKKLKIILIILIGFAGNSLVQIEEGWKASLETVERLSKIRPDLNVYEEKVPVYTLQIRYKNMYLFIL